MSDEPARVAPDDPDAVQQRVPRQLESGLRGVGIAAALMMLLVAMLAPHAGSASGWDVLLFDARAQAENIRLPSRLFVAGAVVFAVVVTAAALVLRRWVLAWVATAGCGLTALFGLLAVWSRQTVPAGTAGSGPGIGLVLAWLLVLVVTFHWVRLVWTQVPAPRGRAEAVFTPKLRVGD